MLHSEVAFKKFKKQLKKDGIKLIDQRPYDETHPHLFKLQEGCKRWTPVADFSGKLLGPAAILGAGKMAQSDQQVVVK